MPKLLHDILNISTKRRTSNPALRFLKVVSSYTELATSVAGMAGSLRKLGIGRKSRVAILLPNCPQFIIASFATAQVGGIFVPINPLQRPRQITHILQDSEAAVLVTTRYLYQSLESSIGDCPNLKSVIFSDDRYDDLADSSAINYYDWPDSSAQPGSNRAPDIRPGDPVSIIYTSGSTGPAKGVILSHANLVSGARIVSGYLDNRVTDRIMAALPLSFDYGFSQVTTAFIVGAEVVLTNYSMPQALLEEISEYEVTALAGVPTMWAQLSTTSWANDISRRMRYITNTGGRLPLSILSNLRDKLPDSKIFLMYGLTEAFRSTYLDPEENRARPDSIGKAIPGVEISIVHKDGSLCEPGELGELVHSGELVALGYWNNPKATARRFRPFRSSLDKDGSASIAVWSGDIVRSDEQGFLYFVEREDEMIKASGYRVSPSEIEEVIYSTEIVRQVVAVGLPDEILGQKVALAIVPRVGNTDIDFAVRHICARELPTYMQPGEIRILESLPNSPNGKPDRRTIARLFG